MAAENETNNTSPPTQLFPPPQLPDTQLPQPQSPHTDYYYSTPHQLYPYMSLFYSNINTPPIKNVQDPPQPIHPTTTNVLSTAPSLSQIWAERNTNKNNLSISPQILNNISPPNDTNNNNNSTIDSEEQDFDTSGYWNIPAPTYGPLASNSNLCLPKHPRIGSQYQATIPSIQPIKKEDSNIIFLDECVWECNKVSTSQLDEYLKIVQFILGTSIESVYTDCHYDEEAALYLLKLHNYNIKDTIHTLTLHKPDKNNLNFEFLFNKNKKNKKDKKDIKNIKNIEKDIDIAEDISSELDVSDNDNEYLYEYSNRTMSINMSQNHYDNDGDDEDDYDDEDYCFSCGDGGNLLICDSNKCMKVWHIHCAGLTKMPKEDEWYCPSHICCICKNKSIKKYQCSYCGNAYCNNNKCIPNECMKYKYHNIEFLCQMCLSTMNDVNYIDNISDNTNINEKENGNDSNNNNNNNNNNNDYIYKFARERFMSRLLELHKRKRNHLNRILKKKKEIKLDNIIPMVCKLGRNEIEWFVLYCAVISCGGLSKIKDLISWDIVREKCNLNKNFKSENIWKSLRDSYIEYLYCYEKQYYHETSHILPRGIQSIVDNKGALDGLFVGEDENEEHKNDDNNNGNNNSNGNGNKTPENVDGMVMDVD